MARLMLSDLQRRTDNLIDDVRSVPGHEGAVALLEEVRAALAAPPAAPSEDAAAHPDEPHEFRTTCLRCGKPGYLHVSVITPDETVTISGPAATEDPDHAAG